jgi:putative transcriptional regulator
MRKLRFNHDEMTQQELAKNIGVTRQTIIAIESRKYSPTLELAFKIADVFQVPLEEIFQYKPKQ